MSRKMKDSGIEWIGEIPKDWEIRKLKHVCNIDSGEYVAKDEYSLNGEYDIIGSNGKIGTINKLNVKKEVITTGRVGSIGNVHIVKDVWVTDNTLIIDNKENVILKYLSYIVPLFQYDLISTGTAQPLITATVLKNQYIPFTKLNEQQKISDFLDKKIGEIDKIIENTKESIEEYKKYKQTIITETVTKGLNLEVEMKDSGIEWIGEIPENWKIKKLRFLGECQNGISKNAESFGTGYPFVSYGDVYKNYALPKTVNGLIETNQVEQNKYSVIYGDVFFTRTSETIEEVGFASTCLRTIKNAVFAGFVIRFRPFNKNELNPNFSKYYFRSNIHRKFFVKEMNLVTRASLSQELLKNLPELLPPIKEQKQIANFLDEKCLKIDTLIEKKEKFIKELETYKQSIIYEYVTGKKEVL